MWHAQDQLENSAIQIVRALWLMTLATASRVTETRLQPWSS
ncbi:hypothetical protein TB9_11275 [Xanthomonas perforans]|uniref:Uncharacterized protein n=1 Tax=Xanthomonas perforans TaxID=442694 RepID=A0ABR5EXU4_XANPE|nr:hypothetical protein BHE83_19575 [Xanthomonas euvesicatoria pv. vesicatoria str. 85-10]APO91688.1 hypothetical protein BJD11_18150 [Xanthomonas euvesicatoria]APO99773.1 hypothetical protein BJD13_12335 [Xanthomonas perforans]OHX23179.1 hypothetical protein BHL63_05475 [Xanthomonas alfalfae]KHL62130.1 hypothetical protein XEU66b_08185 [Xanthomonas euvesicatoria]